jgi:hypothetical protein
MNTLSIRSLLRVLSFSLVVAGMLSLAVMPAHAQFGASLSGTVTDSTGGAIPGATATLVDEATHQTVVHAVGV